ncbi:FAD-binding oxidoreductase [Granulicella arctica]|uniref:FAD-binding oxidoreductase n=1 Tax=Granulicella arctica TaxID=940613 RepID=UPI0021DF6CB4|nr:FAD-binding oxidoreductase [Granulicella arctica]
MVNSKTSDWISRLQQGFGGVLLLPHHEEYHGARRIWNGMIDRTPVAIARCGCTADVVAAVKLARTEGLHLSVRGGGHSVAGLSVCQDGLMIDLSTMKGIEVDPEALELSAEPGVLWAELDAAAELHGLATTGGQISHTGIAGLTLGGGMGYLMGKFGTVCDNLLSVEMVTAEGEIVTASERERPDLFWAMRGAGANFGIVTRFHYRLHPLEGVLAGLLLHPRSRAEELFRFYRDFLVGTPDELTTTFLLLNGPDGSPLVAVIAVYAGPPEEGERVLKPLREFGPPIADLIQPMSYTASQKMVDAAAPAGKRYYWKSNFVDSLDDGLGRILVAGANVKPSRLSMILLFEMKGAIHHVPREAMAFDHRDANFEMSIIAEWDSPADDEANMQWARTLWESTQAFVSNAVYANHMTADEPEERVRAAYGTAKYARLSALKAKYDPTNLFCHNHNIPPAHA